MPLGGGLKQIEPLLELEHDLVVLGRAKTKLRAAALLLAARAQLAGHPHDFDRRLSNLGYTAAQP